MVPITHNGIIMGLGGRRPCFDQESVSSEEWKLYHFSYQKYQSGQIKK